MEVRTFTYDSYDYKEALDLRYRILRKPLHLEFTADELKKDKEDLHFGLFDDGKIIACLILTRMENGRMKMRQVAVDSDWQGKNKGRELSEAAEKYAKKLGFSVMFCHARKVAVPFYEKMGYKIVGDEFTEVNIPHYAMEKEL